MNPSFAANLLCPNPDCSDSPLVLVESQTETINYRTGPINEVRVGSLDCAKCGRSYPIDDFVPSFDQLFPPELKDEATYWGKFYGFMWDRGYLGFFDLREVVAPLITEGIEVLDPSSTRREDSGGTHNIIAQHPAIRGAEWLLDIGCGTGWSSLFFARQGHKVVGFDPSTSNMKLAKQYAISQGEYIEYFGAAIGFLSFKPDVFDAVVALHSIHHVPDLKNEMKVVRRWMREGAGIGIDEHVRNDPMLSAIVGAMHKWASEEVFPGARTLPDEVLEGLPRAEPSALEGAGSQDVIQTYLDNFTLETFSSRYINLDSFSFIYYLSHSATQDSYNYAANVIDLLCRFIYEANPDNAEYVMMIGRKSSGDNGLNNSELVERAKRLAQGNPNPTENSLNSLQEVLAIKNKHIIQLENWAHSLERELHAERQKSLPTHIRTKLASLFKR